MSTYVAGNIGPHRRRATDDEWDVLFAGDVPMRSAAGEVRRQVSAIPLFQSPTPVPPEPADAAYERVLNEAGCSRHRDEVDQRIIDDVRSRKFDRVIRSQTEVGGRPRLK